MPKEVRRRSDPQPPVSDTLRSEVRPTNVVGIQVTFAQHPIQMTSAELAVRIGGSLNVEVYPRILVNTIIDKRRVCLMIFVTTKDRMLWIDSVETCGGGTVMRGLRAIYSVVGLIARATGARQRLMPLLINNMVAAYDTCIPLPIDQAMRYRPADLRQYMAVRTDHADKPLIRCIVFDDPERNYCFNMFESGKVVVYRCTTLEGLMRTARFAQYVYERIRRCIDEATPSIG